MSTSTRVPQPNSPWIRAAVLAAILVAIAAVLFYRSFNPNMVVFSNDGPLGVLMSEKREMPGPFFGFWNPLNWAGYAGPAASPHLTNLTLWLLGPIGFAKFYVPLALVFLGLSAAFFLRQAGLSYPAACLGGVAAMLNSEFLSTACWGLPTWCMSFAFAYLAIAALANQNARFRWLRVFLAGAATGMCVMEGYDVGAIFSLAVAAFAAYQALVVNTAPIPTRVTKGTLTMVLIAGTAALVALHTVNTLVGTQVKGVVDMEQDADTKARRWAEATQWSLPKKEVLSVAVPGLFGYRMDSPEGENYWGQVGRAPGWSGQAQGARFIGGGFYAGVLVVVLALWAVVQSFRRKGSVFSETDRKWIWFWAAVSVLSTLLSFGRYAPFYQLIYHLPFFSTIRNPVKFMHVLNWALIVLFAYGVHGLVVGFAARPMPKGGGGSGWKALSSFDKRWVLLSAVAFVAVAATWLAYASSKQQLAAFLVQEAIPSGMATVVAGASITALGVFLLLFGVTLGVITLVLAGKLRGSQGAWVGLALGIVLVADLGRASLPWIIHVDYKQKLASNPVIEFFRQSPHLHRVIGLPFPAPGNLAVMGQLYTIEWAQHQFQRYNIQSLDVVQMARRPKDVAAFDSAFPFVPFSQEAVLKLPRRWELTNTRFLLGAAGFVPQLNSQVDGGRDRFSTVMTFDVVPKSGIREATGLSDLTAVPSPEGPFAVIEFSGALPRAKLYAQWQVETNQAAVYETLTDPQFDPASTVIVSDELEPPPATQTTNAPPGEVEIVSYAPKRVVLKARNEVPSVLLLNDKYDPNWKLTVDGRPTEILHCNAVMRGVFLTPGDHDLEFRFAPPVNALYVTLASMGVSVLVLGFVVITSLREQRREAKAAEQ